MLTTGYCALVKLDFGIVNVRHTLVCRTRTKEASQVLKKLTANERQTKVCRTSFQIRVANEREPLAVWRP